MTISCEHVNEVPLACDCHYACYCRENSCKNSSQVLDDLQQLLENQAELDTKIKKLVADNLLDLYQ